MKKYLKRIRKPTPFALGGTHVDLAVEVEGEPIQVEGVYCFICEEPKGFSLCEVRTGAELGSGKTRQKAIDDAVLNFLETTDLKEQLKAQPPVTQFVSK